MRQEEIAKPPSSLEKAASRGENDNSPAIYGWDACAWQTFKSRRDERPALPSLPGLDDVWDAKPSLERPG